MYPMPMKEAQQLVAERRASYEAIAFRRQFRRFLTRHAAQPAPVASPFATPRTAVTVTARHDGAAVDNAAVCKVA